MPASLTSTTRSPLTPRAVFAGAICVMAAAVLIAARQPFQQSDVASVSAPPKAMPLPEEVALPNPVTDHGDGRRGRVFIGKKTATDVRFDAKRRKEICADDPAAEIFRGVPRGSRQCKVARLVCDKTGQRSGPSAQIEKVGV